MGDSSDEEISFDDEQIDLVPLWRDSPFLDVPDERETPVEPSNDGNHPSRVIELTPLPATEDSDPLESLMNEINIMSRRVNNARIAHQRYMEGRPQTVEEEPNGSSSNPQPAWASSRGSAGRYPPPTQMHNEPVPHQRMVYRFSQLRHMPAGSGNRSNWSHGRQTFSAVNANNSSRMNRVTGNQPDDEVRFDEDPQPEHHFILPQAIAEREREEEIDDATRAERALFVRQLLLSTFTAPADVLSEAVKKAKAADRKNRKGSKKGDCASNSGNSTSGASTSGASVSGGSTTSGASVSDASTSGANSGKFNSATGSQKPAKDAESSVKIPSDLNKKN